MLIVIVVCEWYITQCHILQNIHVTYNRLSANRGVWRQGEAVQTADNVDIVYIYNMYVCMYMSLITSILF